MKTISIQCVHCQKRYNAPAAMAGKKIKCKACGKVFAIPADAGAGDPAHAEVGEEASQGSRSPAASKAGGGKLGNASAGFATRVARKEDTDELDLATGGGSLQMLRPSIPLDFPGAPVLDQFGPILLTVIGLGWLAMAAYGSGTTPAWVSATRLLAYLVLALGVAFPLGFLAIRHSGRKLRFMLPPHAALRALGAFSLPFALTFIFWLTGQSVGMLIFGAIVGAIVLCGAVWFLFRVQPQETGAVLGSSVGAYIGAVIVSYLILFGAHMAFSSIAKSSGTNQLAMSPMGPFEWDVPVVDLTAKPKTPRKTVVPDTMPSTNPVNDTGTGSLTPTTNPSTGTTLPTTTVASTQQIVNPAIAMATNPGTTGTDVGTAPRTTTTNVKPETPGTTSVKPETPATTVEPVLSPFISKLIPLADLADYNQVIFSGGTGNVVAALKTGAVDETLEFFAGNPLVKRGEATFPVEKDVKQHHILNGNGDLLARLVAWPKLGVQLWNTQTNKEKDSKIVALKPENGAPELLGFGYNDTVVIHWTNTRGEVDIEVIGTKGTVAQTLAFFVVDKFERSPGNPSISPDGRTLALATYARNLQGVMSGGVDLWNLNNTMRKPPPIRTLDVPLKTWVKPTGMAYGPGGARIAALFELDGRGVLYTHRTNDVKIEHEFLFRAPPYPHEAAEGFNGRTLDWLDANTFLIMGRSLIDADTGKVIGDLGIENPKAQRVVDKETLLLQTQNAEGKTLITQVKLNLEAINAKRAELKAK